MKSRINLYQSEFQPRLDLLSPGTLIGSVIVLLAVVVLSWLGLSWSQSQLAEQLRVIRSDNQQLQKKVNTSQQLLQQRKPDPKLVSQVTQLQSRLQNQQRLLQELASREVIKANGFSQLLTDLAQQSKSDLWLNDILISEQAFVLRGQLAKPEALPQWLGRLADTESFARRAFDSARVYREEQQLQFELSAHRQPGTESAGGQQ